MRVYAINGVSLSGKDTFCKMVADQLARELCNDPNMTQVQMIHYYGYKTAVISTIDPVKEIYTNFFGWDGTKTPEHRKNLNTLKLIWISASDGPSNWLRNTLSELKESDIEMVFVMVREYDEMMNAQNIGMDVCGHAETIQLVRHGIPIPPVEQEFLDSHPEHYVYDWTIINPTVDTAPDIPKLQMASKTFIELSKTKTPLHNPVVWNPIDERFVEWVFKDVELSI